MQLTQNFSLEELTHSQIADRNGLDNTPDAAALENLKKVSELLERVRTLLSTPIIVSSGYRSHKVNVKAGGDPKSQHLIGAAVDFISPRFGLPSAIMKKICNSSIPFDQCILEYADNPNGGWIHISYAAKPRGEMLVYDKNGKHFYK